LSSLHRTPPTRLTFRNEKMRYDILIKNGNICDGTGNKPFLGDILIKDGIIAEVGLNINAEAGKVIDARGLVVSPGFIDPHTHCDFTFIKDKGNTAALKQGVTTAIVGLCGLGTVPMRKTDMPDALRLYSSIFGLDESDSFEFENLEEYFRAAAGARINVAAAITHCALRIYCAGYKDFVYEGEIAEKMKSVLREQLLMGAVGFSTGLDYYPARICKTEELIDLCRVVKDCGGVFMIHTRPFATEAYTPMEEVVAIAKGSGVKTHLLHTKTYHPYTSGHPEKVVGPMEKANAEGADITMEFYPYHAFASYAMAFLPSWAMEGDYKTVMSILSDARIRGRLVEETEKGYSDFMIGATPAIVMCAGNHPEYAGKTFDEIAALRNQSIGEMIVDVLYEGHLQLCMEASESGDQKVCDHLERDFMELFRNPIYTVGSDSIMSGGLPHPRAYGTFAKMFRLGRQYGIPVEETVHKLTGFTADRFSLKGRGYLKKGCAADIAVFDQAGFTDRATYTDPTAPAEGMKVVLVNGNIALYDGRETDGFYGTALKKS